MRYEPFPSGVTKDYCNLTATNNVKFYLTVNKYSITVTGNKLSDMYFNRNII